jgi:hypothetical protein
MPLRVNKILPVPQTGPEVPTPFDVRDLDRKRRDPARKLRRYNWQVAAKWRQLAPIVTLVSPI